VDFDWYSSGINLEANWYLMPTNSREGKGRDVKEWNARFNDRNARIADGGAAAAFPLC
jgi:hypothetical protein